MVCIGGGTGTYTVLTGLKNYVSDLTAVVSMADSGGSSGRLRDEFGVLPPGDVRRCLLALSSDPASQVLRQLFSYRFEKGKSLKGHSFGNLLLTALTRITGREDRAILEAGKILHIEGRVLPVTLGNTQLCARLEDGTIIKGETNIDIRRVRPHLKIIDVFLDPPVEVFPRAEEEIKKADLVVMGPGDLYTSVIPNLLVEGLPQAIQESEGTKVCVCNLMTKHGETDNFKASDFIREIQRYLGGDYLDVALVNQSQMPESLLLKYKEEKAFPVEVDIEKCEDLVSQVVVKSLASPKTLFRHRPERLAEAILEQA